MPPLINTCRHRLDGSLTPVRFVYNLTRPKSTHYPEWYFPPFLMIQTVLLHQEVILYEIIGQLDLRHCEMNVGETRCFILGGVHKVRMQDDVAATIYQQTAICRRWKGITEQLYIYTCPP